VREQAAEILFPQPARDVREFGEQVAIAFVASQLQRMAASGLYGQAFSSSSSALASLRSPVSKPSVNQP
jgi:hypothetical protein